MSLARLVAMLNFINACLPTQFVEFRVPNLLPTARRVYRGCVQGQPGLGCPVVVTKYLKFL